MDGEERERKMLEDQIARARAAATEDEEGPKGLERAEGEKIKLSLFPKAEAAGPATSSPASTPAAPAKISIGATGFGSFGQPVVNPLKRAAPTNVFKAAKAAKAAKTEEVAKPKAFMSEAERLMKEDQARKARGSAGGYRGAGPRRG